MEATWQDETLESFDSIELYGYRALPKNHKSIIVMIHGYGEHGAGYREMAEFFCSAGFGIYVFDLRGHGRSGGERGYVQRFEDYLEDLDLIFARIRDKEKQVPILLMGHDIGAVIAGAYTISRKPCVVGTILCSLPFELPLANRQLKLCHFAAKFMPRRLFGKAELAFLAFGETKPDLKDLGFEQSGMPMRVISELVKACEQLMAEAEQLMGSLLIIHAGNDSYGPAARAQRLHDLALSFDKEFFLIEKAEHRLLAEGNKFDIWSRLAKWLDERYQKQLGADEAEQESEAL